MGGETAFEFLKHRIKDLEQEAARFKQSEKDLQRYAFIINTSKDWNTLINTNYAYEAVNRAFCRSLNKTRGQIIGATVADVWNAETFTRTIKPNLEACFTGVEVKDHAWINCPGLGLQCYDITYYPYRANGTTVTHAVVVSRNITELRRAQLELQNYEHIVSASRDLVALVDFDYVVLAASRGYIEFFGKTREAVLGHRISDLVGADTFHKFNKPLADKCLQGNEVHHQSWVTIPDGRKRFLDIAYYPHYEKGRNRVTGYVISARDLTENKHLEKRLRQSYKMEAIGTLAGGIAHDFNNILSAILGYSELASAIVTDDPSLKRHLKRINEAGQRATGLVKQILAFSRQTEQELTPVKIATVVKEVLKLIRASLPSTICIQQRIESSSHIMGDPTQVHQILLNLCTNAGHAMRNGGGTLSVTLADVEIDAATARTHADLSVGTHVRLSVSDTGTGMEPQIIERIFDPFFTTKPKLEGTGMGLSLVHGIVRSYRGTITVTSAPGQGSTFDVLIPIIENVDQAIAIEASPVPTGTERILFVDDEEPLVDIAQNMLERLGYRVTTRSSSIEALRLFENDPSNFDLVITDFTMPTLPGDKLTEQIKAIRPELPIIMATGFSEKIFAKDLGLLGIAKVVMKPLLMRDMAVAIREVLDRR